jgi:hypothetical protein
MRSNNAVQHIADRARRWQIDGKAFRISNTNAATMSVDETADGLHCVRGSTVFDLDATGDPVEQAHGGLESSCSRKDDHTVFIVHSVSGIGADYGIEDVAQRPPRRRNGDYWLGGQIVPPNEPHRGASRRCQMRDRVRIDALDDERPR